MCELKTLSPSPFIFTTHSHWLRLVRVIAVCVYVCMYVFRVAGDDYGNCTWKKKCDVLIVRVVLLLSLIVWMIGWWYACCCMQCPFTLAFVGNNSRLWHNIHERFGHTHIHSHSERERRRTNTPWLNSNQFDCDRWAQLTIKSEQRKKQNEIMYEFCVWTVHDLACRSIIYFTIWSTRRM